MTLKINLPSGIKALEINFRTTNHFIKAFKILSKYLYLPQKSHPGVSSCNFEHISYKLMVLND